MGTSESNLGLFCSESRAALQVWALFQGESVYALSGQNGVSALPFWSSRVRAEVFLEARLDLDGLSPVAIPLHVFSNVWLEKIISEDLEIGVNWVGQGALCLSDREELRLALEHNPT